MSSNESTTVGNLAFLVFIFIIFILALYRSVVDALKLKKGIHKLWDEGRRDDAYKEYLAVSNSQFGALGAFETDLERVCEFAIEVGDLSAVRRFAALNNSRSAKCRFLCKVEACVQQTFPGSALIGVKSNWISLNVDMGKYTNLGGVKKAAFLAFRCLGDLAPELKSSLGNCIVELQVSGTKIVDLYGNQDQSTVAKYQLSVSSLSKIVWANIDSNKFEDIMLKDGKISREDEPPLTSEYGVKLGALHARQTRLMQRILDKLCLPHVHDTFGDPEDIALIEEGCKIVEEISRYAK